MFLYDLGDSSLLSRAEEGQLSRIYQKGCTVEAVTTLLTGQLQREPTHAELADALTDELHGISAADVQQVRFWGSVVHPCYRGHLQPVIPHSFFPHGTHVLIEIQ